MDGLYSPKTVAALLERHALAPLKKLGQNFLCDEHVVNAIAEAAVLPGENVVEIGSGLGVLTYALARRARRVLAIELDAGMVRALEETLADAQNVAVLPKDVLKVDFAELSQTYFNGQPFAVAGNLPYYITAKCLLHVLESGAPVTRYTAMVQREVADRLAAAPGSKVYGALTASVAYFGGARMLFPVSAGCFVPRPDVESAVIQICPDRGMDADRAAYARVVRALFSMRRKTVLNNLKASLGLSAALALSALERAGVDPGARAEQLSPQMFAALACAIYGAEESQK